ncbi:IS4 family transposase [Paracoccus seriniphilus]|nr:IS4 family transposase [Paracoccus seriniphilus]
MLNDLRLPTIKTLWPQFAEQADRAHRRITRHLAQAHLPPGKTMDSFDAVPMISKAQVEELRLATADRLANCIALCCVVAWRVSWLTMLSREAPVANPAAVFTDDERHPLEHATPDRKRMATHDLEFYVKAVARLGGYLDRASDPPPGTTVIWRGLAQLADLVEGARIVGR